MTIREKIEIIDVVNHHAAKIDEAVAAVKLLRQALLALDAEEPLRVTLEGSDPIAALFASELAQNALYEPLTAAEWQLRGAQQSIDAFRRVFNNSFAVYNHRGHGHD